MSQMNALLIILAGAFGMVFFTEMRRRRALRRFWDRACMGIRWGRRFPASPKTEIREFLSVVVDAFGFRPSRRCCFSPDDKVTDIYRALNPFEGLPDDMELETLAERLEERYGVDLFKSCREDITLGDLYAQIKNEPASFRGGGRTACSLASGFFGRWIRWQRPLPAAVGEDFVLATCKLAAVL
jgi:hypothetical protein